MVRRRKSLGRAELEILQYVADHQPISVREVAEHAARVKGHARTTILTVMERLRKKGYLTRRKAKGIYRYSLKLAKAELMQTLVRDFVDGVLGGSVSPLMAYLAQTDDLSDEEIDRLRQLVRRLDSKDGGR